LRDGGGRLGALNQGWSMSGRAAILVHLARIANRATAADCCSCKVMLLLMMGRHELRIRETVRLWSGLLLLGQVGLRIPGRGIASMLIEPPAFAHPFEIRVVERGHVSEPPNHAVHICTVR